MTEIGSSRPRRERAIARYVDGFIVPVPKRKLGAYKRLSQKAGRVWKDQGAIEHCECVADDVKVGKLTSCPRSVNLKRGGTIVFSWIVYRSRAHRDQVDARVMKDPRLAAMMDPKTMPFDSRRMIYGGFSTFVAL